MTTYIKTKQNNNNKPKEYQYIKVKIALKYVLKNNHKVVKLSKLYLIDTRVLIRGLRTILIRTLLKGF